MTKNKEYYSPFNNILFLTVFFVTNSTFAVHHQNLVTKEEKRDTYVDDPLNCWVKKQRPCAVRSIENEVFSSQESLMQFHLGKNSSLEFLSDNKLKIMEGSLWISWSNLEEEFTIQFSKLQVIISSTGDLWIDADPTNKKILLRNLSISELLVQLDSQVQAPSVNSDKKNPLTISTMSRTETLPLGFYNYYGFLDSFGEWLKGVPRPFYGPDTIVQWIQTFQISSLKANENMKRYKELWKKSVETGAEIYKEVVDRTLASQKEVETKKALQIRRDQETNKKMRQMFRNRFFNPDSYEH